MKKSQKQHFNHWKWGFTLNKNTLESIVSTCDFLEWKSSYLIDNWKKVAQSETWIDMTITSLKAENRMEEVEDLQNLKLGLVKWKYKFIQDKNFSRDNFLNAIEFYSYLGNYISLHKDKKIANEYIYIYLNELTKDKDISYENFILPLIIWNYLQNNACKSFIEKNFISY